MTAPMSAITTIATAYVAIGIIIGSLDVVESYGDVMARLQRWPSQIAAALFAAVSVVFVLCLYAIVWPLLILPKR